MGEQARYLYAVCRGLDPETLTGVPALGGGSPEVLEVLGLQAVTSTVDLDEFGEEPLRQNLERLEWVESTARGHDAVVHACAAAAPTAPMRLATICLDDRSIRSRLEEQYDALAAALERVQGRSEWSVKVHAHPKQRQEVEPAEPAAMGGAAYLRRKKASVEQRRAAEAEAVAVAQEVDLALRELAVASRHLRPQDPRLSGIEGAMLLNGAYLVDDRLAQEFAEQVAALAAAHPGVSVSCGGPWPPYSFAMLEPA